MIRETRERRVRGKRERGKGRKQVRTKRKGGKEREEVEKGVEHRILECSRSEEQR